MRPSLLQFSAISASLALALAVGQVMAQAVAPEADHGADEAPAAAAPRAPAANAPRAPGAPAAPAAAPAPAPRPAYQAIRSTDPAAVERGKVLYNSTFACAACHAPDIRGVTGKGNTLMNSVAMMEDANGELIATATHASRTHAGRFNSITEAQFSDLAQFVKSFQNIGRPPIIMPTVFQSGDPGAGQKYFAANCAVCHAVTPGQTSTGANLSKIGVGAQASGIEARNLQQKWLSPSTTKPTTAVVTLPNGEKLQGRATRFNEFVLVLTLADGSSRTINRNGDTPKIEMTYPLAAHAGLLGKVTDKQMNDVTGYLVTLK